MPALKNIRHERFVREYIKTGVGAEAYRRVYPNAKRITTARVGACQLMTRYNVTSRLKELQERAMKRADITMDKILNDYQRAMNMAEEDRKAGEITSAATAQAKLVGLLIDRRELGNAGEFNEVNDIEGVISLVAKHAGPEVAAILTKAFGPEQLAETIKPQAPILIEPESDTIN